MFYLINQTALLFEVLRRRYLFVVRCEDSAMEESTELYGVGIQFFGCYHFKVTEYSLYIMLGLYRIRQFCFSAITVSIIDPIHLTPMSQ